MITIITGEINSGKTTKMIDHYHTHRQGDGFVSIKHMDHHHVSHYDIKKLSSDEKKILMMHELSLKNHQKQSLQVGPYHVFTDSIIWIEKDIKEMIQQKVSPIYLDEIGMLELNNEGFHDILLEMIASNLDLILVIRENLLQEVISAYQFKDISLIR